MRGFRLFRRKKLVSGLTLNLSRSGPSLRIGGRGAGVTVGGRSHLRATVGIPGSGIYYTKTPGGGRRVRRSAAPLRSTYSAPAAATSYKGCLYVVGILVLLGVTIATYGLILIPLAIGVGAWIWYRRRQPDSIAGRIIKQALSAQPAEAIGLFNQALEVDPHGLKTLLACASWFSEHQCYQDAAEAYAGILHIQDDWNAERKYVACLLGAGRADEAIPRLEHIRAVSPPGDSLESAVLGELATAYFLKGEPGQAMAFISLAPLQKRNLDLQLQLCLYLRGVGRYLTSDHRHAIGDLERLYAVNPSFPDVMATKTAMQAGSFAFAPAKPYPDWYPLSHRETDLASEPRADIADATLPSQASVPLSADPTQAAEPTAVPVDSDISPSSESSVLSILPVLGDTQLGESDNKVAGVDLSSSNPTVSPDGAWRWDGTRWIPNSQLEAANVPIDWVQSELWRSWHPPANLIRGESRRQDVFRRRWSISLTAQHWEPVAVDLIREPKNPVDQNAIRAELDGEQIGYLAREVAQIYSPLLDRVGRSHFTVAGVVCGGSADAPSFGLHVWLDKRLTEAPPWEDAGH